MSGLGFWVEGETIMDQGRGCRWTSFGGSELHWRTDPATRTIQTLVRVQMREVVVCRAHQPHIRHMVAAIACFTLCDMST